MCYVQDVHSPGWLQGNKLNYLSVCLWLRAHIQKTTYNETWQYNDNDLSAAETETCPPTCRCSGWWDSAGHPLHLRRRCWWGWPHCPRSFHLDPSCWWSDSPLETTPAHTYEHRECIYTFCRTVDLIKLKQDYINSFYTLKLPILWGVLLLQPHVWSGMTTCKKRLINNF